MQLNVLNDLAKAKRRWTEKKIRHHRFILVPIVLRASLGRPSLEATSLGNIVMIKRSRYKGPVLGSVLDTWNRVGIRCCICSKDRSLILHRRVAVSMADNMWALWCSRKWRPRVVLVLQLVSRLFSTDCRWWFDSPQSASETQDRRPAER